jgi:cytochrome c-type biogenesis protein CcmF
LIGAIKQRDDFVRSGEGAVLASGLAVVVASGALLYALVTTDFRLEYVVDYTSKSLSIPYRVGAMWAGQGGSLLLWTLLTALLGVLVIVQNRRKHWGLAPYAVTTFSVLLVVFGALVAFVSSPFTKMTISVSDGQGLNPLLQDPLQIIHPLALYGGYILYTVPFVLTISALIAGPKPGPWVKVAQRWGTLSWILLTIGIVLGARWAYAELGWGGYWGWDPVENASLLPWLTGTAFLHTGLTHWKTGRIRRLGVVLALVTYLLSLFGTFLTRSGIISSVHAFGTSSLGPIMGGAILAIVLVSGGIVAWRWASLGAPRDDARGHGWVGQRALTVLLVGITIAVLWGTMFPLVVRVLKGQQIAVTPGFFRLVVTPLGILILLIFAISPFLPGQRAQNWQREAVLRGTAAVLLFTGIYALSNWHNPGIALVLTVGMLSAYTVMRKLALRTSTAWRETTGGRALATVRASGPYVGHLGLIVMLAAISLNTSFQAMDRVTLNVGQHKTAAGQTVKLVSLTTDQLADRQSFIATVALLDKNGKPRATIVTKEDVFKSSQSEPHAQVGIHTTVTGDVYVVLESGDLSKNVATISVFRNPAVVWIWFGGFLLVLGGILFALPRRRGAPKLPLDNITPINELAGV